MRTRSKPRLVARTELRRSLRTFRTNRYQLVATAAMALLFFLPMLVFGSLGARGLGETLAAAESAPAGGDTQSLAGTLTSSEFDVLGLVRSGVAMFWVLIAFLIASRAVGKTATIDEPGAVLTAVPVPTVLRGLLLSETVLIGLWVVPPVAIIVGAFALGAGTPLVLVTAALAVALLMASAVPVGYLVGLGVGHLLTINPFLARYKTAIGLVAFLLYFGAVAFAGSLFLDLFAWIGRLPVGWLGDLVLFGAPGVSPSLVRAGAAAGLSVMLALVAGVAAVWLAERHWFADPARDSRPTSYGAKTRRIDAFDGVVSRPTRSVTRIVWLRARRAPIRLLYTTYPLFGLVIFANDLSAVLSYLPLVLTLYVIWAAGAAFTLNPLGDQAGALAATLTTPIDGERFVRGHLLAGAAVFVPLGLLVSLSSAFLVGYPIERVALLGGASVVGTVGTMVLAVGVGSLFPRFGAVRLSGSHEAVMPSKSAFVAYSLVIGLAVASAALITSELARTVLALLVTGLVLDRFSLLLAPDTVLTAAVIGLIVLLTTPLLAYVHAVRSFDRFRIS